VVGRWNWNIDHKLRGRLHMTKIEWEIGCYLGTRVLKWYMIVNRVCYWSGIAYSSKIEIPHKKVQDIKRHATIFPRGQFVPENLVKPWWSYLKMNEDAFLADDGKGAWMKEVVVVIISHIKKHFPYFSRLRCAVRYEYHLPKEFGNNPRNVPTRRHVICRLV